MNLRVESPDQHEVRYRFSDSVECACDSEKLRGVRTYLYERFPDRAIREFHSHSTVVVQGSLPAPCSTYHVVSISDELPYCAVLTNGFLELPARKLRDLLRRWNLARAMQAERTVIVDDNGLSPL
jgi:hypothetical protein